MNKLLATLGTVTAVALATPASAAAFYFPTSTTTAYFGDTITGSSSYTDSYSFVDQVTGEGFLSITSSSPGFKIPTITFNGTLYPGAFSATGVSVGTLIAGDVYTFSISGKVKGTGTYAGTTTLIPAVPEPATWATFLLGFGFLGLGLRRRSAVRLAAA